MKTALASSFLLLLPSLLPAQEGPPKPAPELQKLAAFVGKWTGGGVMTEPGGVKTKWTGVGTYAWCLDGHFLQGDFKVAFEGMDEPFVHRSYLGWDRENKRFVNAGVNSGGQVELHEVQMLPDGTQLQFTLQNEGPLPYSQRSLMKAAGDTLTHSIEILMPDGASMTMIDGKFTRGGDGFTVSFDAPGWMGAAPHAAIARLGKSVGVYDVAGEMLIAPDQPGMKIRGTDTFTNAFGGMVVHGKTEGEAEGMPGKYLGDVFWAHDAKRDCLTAIYVSNFGEVMQMEARWSADGRLIATSHMLYMGQPTVQRMLLEFAADGTAKSAVGHTITGTSAPLESFRATYTKKK